MTELILHCIHCKCTHSQFLQSDRYGSYGARSRKNKIDGAVKTLQYGCWGKKCLRGQRTKFWVEGREAEVLHPKVQFCYMWYMFLINFKYLFWLNIYFFSSEEHTLWVKKQDTKLLPKTSPNINRFSNFFASRLSGKFATKSCLNIPPHLKYWNMLLHYLVKYECQKTGDNLKYALQLMINHKVV